MKRKQHRRGKKASRKLANFEAISESQEIILFKEGPIILCSGCQAEITETDYDTGKCTQCGTKLGE
jgi:hypothetical protein